MNTQTIPFREFMANDYQCKKRIYSASTLYSIGSVSLGALLSPPPLIAKAYMIMFAIGAVTIGLTVLERFFITRELLEIAKSIVQVIKIIMPFVLIAVLVYFVYGNPLIS